MQVTPTIHAIRHPFTVPVAPGIALDRFVYSYILYGEQLTLIDTGVKGSDARIFDNIRSCGRDPSEITLVILTHSHPDHIGAAYDIQQATGCRIAAHPDEKSWIEDVNCQYWARPVPGFYKLVSGSVQLDRKLRDNELIYTGGGQDEEIRVIHTPGHSPGSISLLIRGKGVLFSGDAIPVPGDIPIYDDALLSAQSLMRLWRLTCIDYLLPAWHEPVEGPEGYREMSGALEYIQAIHVAVLTAVRAGSPDPVIVARKVAATFGLPPGAVNPLFARTISANLRVRNYADLLTDPPG